MLWFVDCCISYRGDRPRESAAIMQAACEKARQLAEAF